MNVSLSGLEIKEASSEDISAIEAIYRYYVENTLISMEEISPSMEELDKRRKTIQERGLPYIVIKWQEEVIGYAYAAPYHTRSGYYFSVEDSIYVNSEYRGKGIGLLLLTEIISRCQQKGYRQMIAMIANIPNSASLQLHTKLGFKPIGTLKAIGFKFDTWVDVIIMQRMLAS